MQYGYSTRYVYLVVPVNNMLSPVSDFTGGSRMIRMMAPWILTNRRLDKRLILLLCAWVVGFVTGLHISAATFDTFTSLMRAAVSSRVSIFGLIAALIFPLILSTISVQLSAPLLFLPLSFTKAFGLAYCGYAIVHAFGDAGWLVAFFLLFTDFALSLLLLWLWIRNISATQHSFKKDVTFCAIIAVLVGCLDYLYVSPFLSALFC